MGDLEERKRKRKGERNEKFQKGGKRRVERGRSKKERRVRKEGKRRNN